MRSLPLICRSLLLTTALLLSTPAAAEEAVVVIVNSANQQDLTLADVRNIYRDKIVTWENEQRISVYNLPVSHPAREVFSREVLGISAMEAAAAVSNRSITNTLRNIQRTASEQLLITVVSKKHTAIGYCSRKAIRGKLGVRVIATLE